MSLGLNQDLIWLLRLLISWYCTSKTISKTLQLTFFSVYSFPPNLLWIDFLHLPNILLCSGFTTDYNSSSTKSFSPLFKNLISPCNGMVLAIYGNFSCGPNNPYLDHHTSVSNDSPVKRIPYLFLTSVYPCKTFYVFLRLSLLRQPVQPPDFQVHPFFFT